MSGKRQHISSGTVAILVLLIGVGWGTIWLAPLWVEYFFPNFLVWSAEPWQLKVSDLTWQRVISNIVVKPGFRTVLLAAYGVVVALLKVLVLDKPVGRQKKRPAYSKAWLAHWRLVSGEFVVDGKRGSILTEYARVVQAV